MELHVLSMASEFVYIPNKSVMWNLSYKKLFDDYYSFIRYPTCTKSKPYVTIDEIVDIKTTILTLIDVATVLTNIAPSLHLNSWNPLMTMILTERQAEEQ